MDIVAKIKAFHQLQSDLRQGKEMLIVGVDVGKHSSKACFYSFYHDVLLKKFHVAHCRDGFVSFIEKIEHMKKLHGLDAVVIGFEPTGTYHKVLGEYLRKRDYNLVYVSSAAVKNNRKTLAAGRWGKNDPRDAFNVVDLLRQGKIQFYRDKDTVDADIRGYLLLHRRLTKARAALKNRVRNNLWACYFPELDELFPNVDNADALNLLEHFRSVDDIRTMDYSTFVAQFPTPSPRQHRRLARLQAIWEAAQISIGLTAPSSVAYEARLIARNLRQIKSDFEDIEEKLADYVNAPGCFRRLLSIPGFGVFTTAVFKSAIGDINAFRHSRQFTRLAGIDVESMTSGKYAGHEKISKKGMSLLRYALCHAVTIAVTRNKPVRALFERKLQALGGSRQARAKLKIKFADKLLRTAFALLKNDMPFDVHRFSVPVDDPVLDSVRA